MPAQRAGPIACVEVILDRVDLQHRAQLPPEEIDDISADRGVLLKRAEAGALECVGCTGFRCRSSPGGDLGQCRPKQPAAIAWSGGELVGKLDKLASPVLDRPRHDCADLVEIPALQRPVSDGAWKRRDGQSTIPMLCR